MSHPPPSVPVPDESVTLPHSGRSAADGSTGDARAPTGYAIEKELGRGGMGVVYLARSLALHRPCALKMILSGAHSGEIEFERFRTEAQAIARLSHPGIVQVYEVGEHDGRPFMALEFCPGGSLDEKLLKNPLKPREAAVLVKALAEAVQAAHEAKVVHRDLKPANVLLTEKGEPKITDFGLAKKLDEGGATRTGSVMGTPSYMPPEQAEGKKDIGPAADIYALGAILYECLASRPPFKAATALDTILQVVTQEPLPLRALNPQAPADLETIAHKCLQKDPARRYGSAGALADDLGRWLAGEPIVARPVGPLERAVKWVRRNAVVSALAAAVFVALTAGVIVSAVLRARAVAAADLAERKAKEADDNWERAENEAREAKRLAGERKLALDRAEGLWLTAQSEQTRPTNPGQALLLAVEGARRHRGLHANNALIAAMESCRERRTFVGHTSEVANAVFSPDGRRLLTYSQDETARIWDVASGKELHRLGGHRNPSYVPVCWSPDGTRVLTIAASVYRWPGHGGGGSSGGIGSFFTFRTWDAATGKPLATWKEPAPYKPGEMYRDPLVAAAFSPDGRRVLTAACVLPGWPTVHDADTGKELAALKHHKGPPGAAAWSPDGKRLATAGLDGSACLWDADTYQWLHELRGHEDASALVLFSPDSKRVLTVGEGLAFDFVRKERRVERVANRKEGRPGARVWDVSTGTQRAALKWPIEYRNAIWTAAWSPNGKWIVTGGNGSSLASGVSRGGGTPEFPIVWDASTGEVAYVLAPPAGTKGFEPGVFSVAFSPDSQRILTANRGRTAHLWTMSQSRSVVEWAPERGFPVRFASQGLKPAKGDLRALELAAELRGHEGDVYSASFSPDGRWAATASADGTARVWDAVLSEQPRPDTLQWRTFDGYLGMIMDRGFALSPDGRRIALGNRTTIERKKANEPWVGVWDLAAGTEVVRLYPENPRTALAFGPDADTLITAGDSGRIEVWDLKKPGKPTRVLGDADDRGFLAAGGDGRLVATAARGNTVQIWDTGTGKRRGEVGGAVSRFVNLQEIRTLFSPDGGLIAFQPRNGRGPPIVCDTGTGKERCSLQRVVPDGTWSSLTFSPDGKRVLATGPRKGWVWDTSTGEVLCELTAPVEDWLYGSAFSSDGERIVTGTLRKGVRLWHGRTGKRLHTLHGHNDQVYGGAFSRDGTLIVTGSMDKTVRVWEASTAKEVMTLKHTGQVIRVGFTPDDRHVYSVAADVIRLWPVNPLPIAEGARPRDFTAKEKEMFLIGDPSP